MGSARLVHDVRVRVAVLIGVCFLLGSTGWLAWLYRIMEFADPACVDFYTMVVGYLFQAFGIGAYLLAARRLDDRARKGIAVFSLVAYAVLLDPAIMADGLAASLGFGWAMGACCGVMQGHYLACLAGLVGAERRGTAFGCSYAASTLATWALASIGDGALAAGLPCLATCSVLSALAIVLVLAMPGFARQGSARLANPSKGLSDADGVSGNAPGARSFVPHGAPGRGLIALACVTVVLVSMVKNAGFSFPAADLSGVVNLELSRLFYGAGLVVAGVAADRDRRCALACCAASLAVPFLMLALSGAGAPSVVLWALGYLLFGFFAVWRVTLFADLAAQGGRVWLAGGGLLLGRVGDALGTVLCLAFAASAMALIVASAIVFAVAAVLLIILYLRLYEPAAAALAALQGSGRDLLAEFADRYGLSGREREVLSLVVAKKSNVQIARELFIAEGTVKFHVRNILKKTGCANRVEAIALYADGTGRKRGLP